MATAASITEIRAAAAPDMPALDQLCFTARRPDDGIDLWHPPEIYGDWAEQCRRGREFADEAVKYILASGDHALLPGIVRTFAERGKFGGVETGFLASLSMRLAAAAD